ncbi:hypothetical protein PMIN04_013144 [Paraphaeosphaeria minitans]
MLSRPADSYFHDLPIDTCFIQTHGILFGKHSADRFEDARFAFQSQLNNHIGRVTAKWKEQGVYVAVTNLSGLFSYGSDNSILRQIFILHGKQLAQSATTPAQSDKDSRSPSLIEDDTSSQTLLDSEVPAQIETPSSDFSFSHAYLLTMTTLTLVLRRTGDKNVLPYVHVLLAFLLTLASIKYVAHFNDHAPWTELVSFLSTLLKSEQRPEKLILGPVFPEDQADSLPLPENFFRGQIWSQWYLPDGWFEREHDEQDRSQEFASTVKLRTERVLHLGYELANYGRWISYNEQTQKFSVTTSCDSSQNI